MTVRGDTEQDRALMGIHTGETPNPMLSKPQSISNMEKSYCLLNLAVLWEDLNSVPPALLWSVASKPELSGQLLIEFFLSLPLGVLSSIHLGTPWAAWSLHGSLPSSIYHRASSRSLP